MTTHRPPHPLNRHLFIADNLDLLRRLDNDSIDLICIDPPFKKRKTFVGKVKPPLTDAELQAELDTLAGWGISNPQQALDAGVNWPSRAGDARFKDMWSYDADVDEDWVQNIAKQHTGLHGVIEAAKQSSGLDTAAYLCYMGVRLIQMHRALKPTGSLYLHCDSQANSYLRLTLDAIFGPDNYLNELIWSNQGSWVQPDERYPRRHETVLLYTKSDEYTFHPQYEDNASEQMNYRRWQKYLKDGNKIYGGFMPDHDKRFKSYLDNFIKERGHHPGENDVVLEITGARLGDVQYVKVVDPKSAENTGYPTQKPVALAERLIKTSSNPGDVVLDCFAGCAYVPVAAERNRRQWIACDISPRALTVLRRQFAKFRYAVDGQQQTDQPALLTDANVVTAGPNSLPERTDDDPEPRIDPKEPEPPKYKTPASIIPEPEMLRWLLELSGWQAWCCGFANRRKDGTIIATTRNFHLDHLNPKSKEGSSNQIINRAPMCPHHNIRKNNRRVHLAEYRQEIADAGELMVDYTGELIDLDRAVEWALEIYTQARLRQGAQATLPGNGSRTGV